METLKDNGVCSETGMSSSHVIQLGQVMPGLCHSGVGENATPAQGFCASPCVRPRCDSGRDASPHGSSCSHVHTQGWII